MTTEEILTCFRQSHALLDGHFVLRSGLHSRHFFQCALVWQHPRLAEQLCAALTEKLVEIDCETVISPALGGIVVGNEVGSPPSAFWWTAAATRRRILAARFSAC